jgi:uncharacterized protein YndB with AHSA1/START domain
MSTASTIEAKVTHRFRASPEEIYEAWLEPEIIRSWMSLDVPDKGIGEVMTIETDPQEGGRFLFTDRRADGEARHWGNYTSLHRPHKIAFTWVTAADQEDEPSLVTIVILPHPAGGTAVTLTHDVDERWADYLGQVEKGWGVMLAQMEALLDGAREF